MKRELKELIQSNEARSFDPKVILINDIKESPTQARTKFKEEDLKNLAESIKANGILQPVVVQVAQNGTYKLIAGERRLRAAKIAGMDSVPCVIKDVSKRDAAVMGLVENIQREKLGPIDESEGFRKLIEEHSLTINDISLFVGKSRSYISNSLRLSGLVDEIRQGLRSGEIKVGQVRPLLTLNENKQKEFYREILLLNLSSREVEERVSNFLGNKKENYSEELLHAKGALEDYFGKPIVIKSNGKNGKIEIGFKSKEDLLEILNKLR
jgi:ParB family chromosome partitioning protein